MSGMNGTAGSFGSMSSNATPFALDAANTCPSPYVTVNPVDGSLTFPRMGTALSGGLAINWASATIANNAQATQNWTLTVNRPGGNTCRTWGYAAVLRSPSITHAIPNNANNWIISNFTAGGDAAWQSDRVGPADTYGTKYGDHLGPLLVQQNGIAAATASVNVAASLTVYVRQSGTPTAPNFTMNQMSAGRIQWVVWSED